MDELISEMSNLIYHIAHEFTSNSDLINDLYMNTFFHICTYKHMMKT